MQLPSNSAIGLFISAVIASSATAFTTIKFVGALSLIVVGTRRVMRRGEDAEAVGEPTTHLGCDVDLLADPLAGRLRRSGTGAKLRRFVSDGISIALGVAAATGRRVS